MVSLTVECLQKYNCISLVLRKHICPIKSVSIGNNKARRFPPRNHLRARNTTDGANKKFERTKEIPFHTLLTCSCTTKIKFEGEDLKQVIKSEYIGITKPQQFRPQKRIDSDHKGVSIPSTKAHRFPPKSTVLMKTTKPR